MSITFKPVQQRSKKNGRFLAVYDWDKVVPEICRHYAAGKLSIMKILELDGMPSWYPFWAQLQANADYMAQWDNAGHGKAATIDSAFDQIVEDADKAFANKDFNPNALKVKFDVLKTQRGHLNPKYRDRKVEHVHEVGPSMRQIMTEARQRHESFKLIEGEFTEE